MNPLRPPIIPTESNPKSRWSLFNRAWIVIWLISLLAAVVYVGGVLYSRHQRNQALAEQKAARERAQDQEAFEDMGGNSFSILNFYASPRVVHRGESSELCYGVSNAKTVQVVPQAGPTWPAFSRCLQVMPRKTTTYTLTATSGSGERKTATAEIEVR